MKLLFIFLLLVSIKTFAKEPQLINSGDTQLSLLELYSSEGCNSCPPAERQLYALRSDKNLWKEFVPMNFHVDYWNRLGWVDRFSNEQFTKRQQDYAALHASQKVYTPQFILDSMDAGSYLKKTVSSNPAKVGNLSLKVDGQKKISVSFHPTKDSAHAYTLYFAVLGNELQSTVTSGENKGETLKHNFVVLAFDKIEVSSKDKLNTYEANFNWPDIKNSPQSLSVTAWATEGKTMKVIQAAGADLAL